MHHRASTLSASQKALSVLLSIILVVGLSPFGQGKATQAWADDPADTIDPSDVIAAPLVAHTAKDSTDIETAIALVDYSLSQPSVDETAGYPVVTTTMTALGLPSYANKDLEEGLWVGIGVPYVGNQYKYYYNYGTSYTPGNGADSFTDTPDDTYVVNDKPYATFYIGKSGLNQVQTGMHLGVWDTTANGGSGAVVAVYKVSASADTITAGNMIEKTVEGDDCDVTFKVGATEVDSVAEGAEVTVVPEASEGMALKTLEADDKSIIDDMKFTAGDSSTTVSAVFAQKYGVSVADGILNGAVTVDHDSQFAGEDVTVTATPAAGYAVGQVTCTDENGSPVTVTGGKFAMPASDVTVSATFDTAPAPTGGSETKGTNTVALVAGGTTFYYKNIEDALVQANANPGRTVQLLDNYTAPKTLGTTLELGEGTTLDLNGKTLTLAQAASEGITVSGNATIAGNGGSIAVDKSDAAATTIATAIKVGGADIEASIEGAKVSGPVKLLDVASGKLASKTTSYDLTNAATADDGKPIVTVEGELAMESGSIASHKVSGAASGYNGMAGVEVAHGATLTLGKKDGGEAPSIDAYGSAIKVTSTTAGDATVKVLSGKYTSSNADGAIELPNSSVVPKVTISGGTFTGAKHAIDENNSSAVLKISGGTLNGTATTAAINNANAKDVGHIAISGGTFTGKANWANTLDKAVSGGSFANPIVKRAADNTANPPVTAADECVAGYAPNGTSAPYSVIKTLDGATVTVGKVTYNGKEQTPEVTVQHAGAGKAIDTKDYKVTFYKDEACTLDASTTVLSTSASIQYYAKVTPNSPDYLSTSFAKSGAIVVEPVDISKADVELRDAGSKDESAWKKASEYKAAWTGNQVKPEVRLTIGGTPIPQAGNYAAITDSSYGTNRDAGAAAGSVTVSPSQSSYSTGAAVNNLVFGSSPVTANFEIAGASLEGATVKLSKTSTGYTGSAIAAAELPEIVSVTTAGATAVASSAYDIAWADPYDNSLGASTKPTAAGVVRAGDYTVTVTGKAASGTTGSATAKFTVTPVDITNATVAAQLAATEATWDGTVKDYKDVKALFSALPTSITVGSQSFTGLAVDKDYTVTPTQIAGAGSYQIALKGQGNFTGSKVIGTYTVKQAEFDAVEYNAAQTTATYDGKSKSAAIEGDIAKATFKKGTAPVAGTLAKDADYTLAYYAKTGEDSAGKSTYDSSKPLADPTDAGTYVVVVTGTPTGSYAGTAQIDFVIAPEAITDGNAFASGYEDKTDYKEMTYTGTPLDVYSYIEKIQVVHTKADSTKELVEFGAGEFTVYPSKIEAAGAATLTITLKGNYGGTYKKSVTVNGAALNKAATAADIATTTYDTKAKEIDFKVTNTASGAELVEGVDYEIAYVKGSEAEDGTVSYDTEADTNPATQVAAPIVDAGKYQATITGKSNYYTGKAADAIVKTFEVSPASINALTGWKADSATFSGLTYTGKAQEPRATADIAGLKLGDADVTLTQGTDYKASKVTDAGTQTVTLTGAGNYKDDAAQTFTVEVAKGALASTNIYFKLGSLDQWVAAANGDDAVYTTAYGVDPTVEVRMGDATLSAQTDYEISFTGSSSEGAKTGTVTVKARANGNVSGGATAKYNVSSDSLADATVTLATGESADYKGAGYASGLAPVVTLGGKALALGANYTLSYYDSKGKAVSDITDAGSYTVVATGVDKAGAASAPFTVNKVDLAKATKIVNITQVSDRGDKGSKDVAFASKKITYTGHAYKYVLPSTGTDKVVQVGASPALVDLEADDVDVAYEANKDAGTAKATFTVKAGSAKAKNYANGFVSEFKIEQAEFKKFYDLKPAEIGGDGILEDYAFKASWDFTGSQVKPEVQVLKSGDDAAAVKAGTATVLDAGEYTLFYGENTNVSGNNYVKAFAKEGGNFTGELTLPVAIKAVKFDEEHVSFEGLDDVKYTGEAQTPAVLKLKGGDYELKAGTDYLVTYANNTEVGDATASFAGQSNFSSLVINKTFKIAKADSEIAIAGKTATYNGNPVTVEAKATGTSKAPVVKYYSDGKATLELPGAPVNAGTYYAKATAEADDNYAAAESAVVTVKIDRAGQAVAATPASVTVAAGKTAKVAAKGQGAVSFRSADEKVAKVAADGTVTGVKAGKTKITVSAAGDANYNPATAVVDVTVTAAPAPAKKANTVTAKAKKVKASAKQLKAKKVAVKAGKYLAVSKAQGKVTYKLNSAKKGKKAMAAKAVKKSFKVNAKNGKLVIKKGVKAGAYKLSVTATAAGNAQYKAGSVTKVVKVKVSKK